MQAHPDILDERESLSRPLLVSILFHAGVAGGLLALTWAGSQGAEKWGDPNALPGGAVGITAVKTIDLPSRQGRVNPVANDTESQIPARPVKPEPKSARKPDLEAIPIKSRNAPKRQSETPDSPQKFSPLKQPAPSQVYSSTAQATTSPMFSRAGSGEIGSGTGTLGTRFGGYIQVLRDTVARNWRSDELDARIQTAAVVTFELLRNGTVQNVRVTQPSGNFAMDQSAQRAVIMSSPFPPMPAQYEGNSATVELWFRLRK